MLLIIRTEINARTVRLIKAPACLYHNILYTGTVLHVGQFLVDHPIQECSPLSH